MDQFDRAQALEQLDRDAAIAQRWQPNGQPSLSHCEECGEEIPTARQVAMPGCTRCINCQEYLERKARL